MRRPALLIVVIAIILHGQCRKDSGKGILNCEKFRSALEAKDSERLKPMLDGITRSLGEIQDYPEISTKVSTLIKQINNSHCLLVADTAIVIIDTNPPIAEIGVSSSITGNRFYLDFQVKAGRDIEFLTIHN